MSGFRETPERSQVCDICGNTAREFCFDCQQHFCETCKLHHLKILSLKGHRFRPYSEDPPPSYDEVVRWNPQGVIASAPPLEDVKILGVTNAFEEIEDKFDYVCIECRLLLTDRDVRGHLRHDSAVFDVTGERSYKCLPVLVPLLQDSSSPVQKSTIDVLERLLDKRSSSFNQFISKEEVMLISNIILTRVVQPALQTEQVMDPFVVKALVVLRNLSEISKQEGEIQHLREQRELVNSLIQILKLYIMKFGDIDGRGTTNCLGALFHLSHGIVDERENEEENLSGTDSLMSKLFSNKGKLKQSRSSEPIKGMPVPRDVIEYKGLWSVETIGLFGKILKDATDKEILQSTMNILINMLPFVWRGGRDICTWLRREKVLPSTVELLYKEDLVKYACNLMLCLICDDTNKRLFGKYAMKQIVSLLPSNETTRRPDDVVSTVLSILIKMSNGKEAKEVHESINACSGIEKIKYIKFTPHDKTTANENYEEAVEIKEKASELLSILWKSESGIVRSKLRKSDVKTAYVL